MKETLKLELQFLTTDGRKRTLNINEPIADLTKDQVEAAMKTIADQKIFEKDGEHLYETVAGARYVNRQVENVFQTSEMN